MAKKLSKEERDRVRLHRKVAPAIPQKRPYKSIEGQKYFDFNLSFTVRDQNVCDHDEGRITGPSQWER